MLSIIKNRYVIGSLPSAGKTQRKVDPNKSGRRFLQEVLGGWRREARPASIHPRCVWLSWPCSPQKRRANNSMTSKFQRSALASAACFSIAALMTLDARADRVGGWFADYLSIDFGWFGSGGQSCSPNGQGGGGGGFGDSNAPNPNFQSPLDDHLGSVPAPVRPYIPFGGQPNPLFTDPNNRDPAGSSYGPWGGESRDPRTTQTAT